MLREDQEAGRGPLASEDRDGLEPAEARHGDVENGQMEALPGHQSAHLCGIGGGRDVEANAVHGSDGSETAASEIVFFFKPEEIFRSFK